MHRRKREDGVHLVGIMRVFVLLVALAGCASVPAPVPDAPVPVDDAVRFGDGTWTADGVVYPLSPAFPAPKALPGTGAEPNIARMEDGTLFVTTPAGGTAKPNALEGAAWLWRSQDDGATWEVLRSPAAPAPLPLPVFCSCDADVVVSPDGWVYYTDWWIAVATGNVIVERSSDGGDNWEQASVTIPTEKAQSIDRQWLVAGPDGFVMLVYAQFGSTTNGVPGPDGRIEAVLSDDHGQTWSAPVHVVPRDGAWVGLGHPFFAGQTLAMPYAYVRETDTFWTDPSEVRIALSDDLGQTWRQEPVAQVPGGFDNLWAVQGAADGSGNIYVGWAHRDGDNMTVSLAASHHGWNVTDIAQTGLHMLPWLAATGNQTVSIGWYGSFEASGDPADQPGGLAWHAWLAESHDGGASGTITQVSQAPVRMGSFCPRGAGCSEDRELLDYWSMLYGPDGRLHAAYAAMGGGDAVPQYAVSGALGPRVGPVGHQH